MHGLDTPATVLGAEDAHLVFAAMLYHAVVTGGTALAALVALIDGGPGGHPYLAFPVVGKHRAGIRPTAVLL